VADINLRINGDASGGVDAMDEMGDAVGKSAVKWQEMANAAKFAAKEIAAFLVDSTKKYAESERVLRQLERASKEYAGALEEQAKALSALYAVDDDLIMQSETLLAQWGGAAAASREAEEAALNLASAMGTDLATATEVLIRNVESGGTGLAKMGIHFEATGDKGKDLEAAIAAINKKIGGAAAADANSLTGQLHAASLAFEDIQKSIGGSVAEFLKQHQIVEKLTAGLRSLNDTFTPEADKKAESKEYIAQQVHFWEEIAAGHITGWKDAEAQIKFTFEEAQAELAKWQAKLSPQNFNAAVSGGPRVTGTTNRGGKEDAQEASRAAKEAAKEAANIRREMAEADAREQKEFQKAELDAQDDYAKESIKIEKERLAEIAKAQKAEEAASEKAQKEKVASELKAQKEAAQLEEKALKDQQERVEKKAKEAKAAGDAIGAAMVNALADQLSKLAEGGEFDAALFIGDILAAAVGVAGTVIGTAFGAPAVGAAIGNLAAMGVRAGASAISKGGKKQASRTYHDGGWVDAPRYHDGTWIGPDEQRAVLQHGERVLSRREVHHMGGPGVVDNMARGGGSRVTLNVQAIDAKSVADTFSGSGADGLKQAMRRGHGALPALLGRSPR
jgi:hypothetical protein